MADAPNIPDEAKARAASFVIPAKAGIQLVRIKALIMGAMKKGLARAAISQYSCFEKLSTNGLFFDSVVNNMRSYHNG